MAVGFLVLLQKLFEYMAMGKPIIASDLEQIGIVLKNSLKALDLPNYQPALNLRSLGCCATLVL